MFECRHCREMLRGPIEKLGARCPNCRLPLLERPDRLRPLTPPSPRRGRGQGEGAEPKDTGGNCASHAENPAVSRCGRCGQALCALCRTRWHEEVLCPVCAGAVLQAGEVSPRELAQRERWALWGFGLALAGWTLLLVTIIPWVQLQTGRGDARAIWSLFLASLFPALVALGQGAAAVRHRAGRLSLATSGLILGGLQIGLMIGVLLINLWHN